MNGIHDCAWTDCLISERIDTVLRHHHLLPPADIKPCRLELVIKTFPEAGFQRWGPLTCFHKVLCSLLFLKFKSLFFFYISYIFISIHIYMCVFFFFCRIHIHMLQSYLNISYQMSPRCSSLNLGKLTLQRPRATLPELSVLFTKHTLLSSPLMFLLT